MRELFPYIGDTKARDAWDEIFSRRMLGSVLVGAAAGKVIEKIIILLTNSTEMRLVAWFLAFWIFVFLFVFWHRIVKKAEAVKEEVEEKTE